MFLVIDQKKWENPKYRIKSSQRWKPTRTFDLNLVLRFQQL